MHILHELYTSSQIRELCLEYFSYIVNCDITNTQVDWEVLPPPNGHIGHTTIDSYYTIFNKWRLPFKVHAELHQVDRYFNAACMVQYSRKYLLESNFCHS